MADVVVPFSSDCGHRKRALSWLLERLPATVGYCPPPWRKAVAVADGVSRTSSDVIVVHDADVWCDELDTAIKHVEAGMPWAIPHHRVHRLDADATEQVYAGAEFTATRGRAQKPYTGYAGGGIVVLRRDVWEQAPMDPRFAGWGHEDSAWALALLSLFGGPWRGNADLFHLWHPEPPRLKRNVGSHEARRLELRYRHAFHDRDAMRALIDEAKERVA